MRADTQSNTSRPTWDPTVPTEDKGINQVHSTFSAKYVLSLFLILLKTSGLIMTMYLIDLSVTLPHEEEVGSWS